MTEQEYIDAAEARRKKRERELLLLLLLLTSRANREGISAYRHGLDWPRVIDNVITGNPASGMRGAVPGITAYLLSAHKSGAMLAGTKMGYNFNGDIEQYRPGYLTIAAGFVVALADAIKRSFFDGGTGGTIGERIKGIRGELESQGYTVNAPHGIELGIERAIVGAFNNGVYHATAERIGLEMGLRHCSVLDSRTTEWCRPRDGLTLTISNPYWKTNTPPLHPRCRSLLAPIKPPFEISDIHAGLPPPFPGFGKGL